VGARQLSNYRMTDLKSKSAIYLKAILFLVIGFLCAFLLIAQNPTVQAAILICLTVWSFCRAYYFAFYVIERYVDPTYRFAGLFDFAKYLLRRK
jgi:hypothetical protein